LVAVRHGQREWNEQNRFTGWVDRQSQTKDPGRHALRL
jgi:bisphosphoglycerate-dependent phosphoglycerate mutase